MPVDVNETFRKLPGCDDIHLVKLKKKLSFKGHFGGLVNTEKVRKALLTLKELNHLYSNVNVDISVIPSNLVCFEDNNTVESSL